MKEVNVKDASVTSLLEIDGDVFLIAMSRERLEAIQALVRASAEIIVPTHKTQAELNEFLNYKS